MARSDGEVVSCVRCRGFPRKCIQVRTNRRHGLARVPHCSEQYCTDTVKPGVANIMRTWRRGLKPNYHGWTTPKPLALIARKSHSGRPVFRRVGPTQSRARPQASGARESRLCRRCINDAPAARTSLSRYRRRACQHIARRSRRYILLKSDIEAVPKVSASLVLRCGPSNRTSYGLSFITPWHPARRARS